MSEDFDRVFNEWLRVRRKMYDCLSMIDEPFSGNSCYKRFYVRYKVLFNLLMLLSEKEGVSFEDLLAER